MNASIILILLVLVRAAVSMKITEAFPYNYLDPGKEQFVCHEGWTRRGLHCYKTYNTKLAWSDAEKTCKNVGADLARPRSISSYIFIGTEAVKTIPASPAYWIGFRGNESVYWENGEMIPTGVAYWDDNQPTASMTMCVSATVDSVGFYKWKYEDCDVQLPFVCQAEACLQGFFKCASGHCIQEAYKCDRHEDCADGSDEIFCPGSPCAFYQNSENGVIQSATVGGNYVSDLTCLWVLQGPVGTQIQLKFESFNTETNSDFVEIWIKGSTIEKSKYITSLSGELSVSNLPTYISTNNFMIIRFTSDSGGVRPGFIAAWTTKYTCEMKTLPLHKQGGQMNMTTFTSVNESVCASSCLESADCNAATYTAASMQCNFHTDLGPPQGDPCCSYLYKTCPGVAGASSTSVLPGSNMDSLTATQMMNRIHSPFYPGGYPHQQDLTWTIKAQAYTVISIIRLDMDLGAGDELRIINGEKADGSELARFTGDGSTGPIVTITTAEAAYISFTSPAGHEARGFLLGYQIGCSVTIEAGYGIIQSPGYGVSDYPKLVNCKWTILIPSGQQAVLRFPAQYGFNLGAGDLLRYSLDNSTGEAVAGTQRPGDMRSTASVFYLYLQADAVTEGVGFKAVFSADCPDPQYAQKNILASTASVHYGATVTLTCPAGYYFAVEGLLNLTQSNTQVPVEMECLEGGKWSIGQIPPCSRMHCGFAPQINNGYMTSATSMVYQGQLLYTCFSDFIIDNSDPVLCNNVGQWNGVRTCTANQCPSAPNVANSIKNVTNDSNNQGNALNTIIEYICDEGYNLIGTPILICQNDGTWSATPPRCDKIKCEHPYIHNGNVNVKVGGYEFLDVATVNCEDGYFIEGTNSTTSIQVTCGADHQFMNILHCVDGDACLVNNGGCSQVCRDYIGPAVCDCFRGYRLEPSSNTNCTDIDECAEGVSGCSHGCVNDVGNYTCTCPMGYELFTDNGQMGYTVAGREDGMEAGDIYHFNHTCIKKVCPELNTTFENGTIMTEVRRFYYLDKVEYICNLGHVLIGSGIRTCSSDGTWDAEAPTCAPVFCPAVNITGLVNPPALSVTGDVPYGFKVNLTCTVPGQGVFVRQQTCRYDFVQGLHSLLGDPVDCAVIDCGIPEPQPDIMYTVSTTTYGSSFTFNCTAGTVVYGNSSQGDQTVRCTEDGVWDFGNLMCFSKSCEDPGRPSGGQQVNVTSYEEGQQVFFECFRSGFEPSPPSPLLCTAGAPDGSASWDGPVPDCIDIEAPVFIDCPVNWNITVKKYDYLEVSPNATDNSGALASLVSDFQHQALVNDTRVTWTATDHAGNSAQCVLDVTVLDTLSGITSFTMGANITKLVCPPSGVEKVMIEDEIRVITFPDTNYTAEPNPSASYVITYSPSSVNVSRDTINQAFTVVASAALTSGVVDACCRFQIFVQAETCNPWVLRTPLNGRKECNATSDGYFCQMFCNEGYSLLTNETQNFTCTSGSDAWSPSMDVLDCAEVSRAPYTLKWKFRYDSTAGLISDPCLNIYQNLTVSNYFNTTSQGLTKFCQDSTGDTSFGLFIQGAQIVRQDFSMVEVSFEGTFYPANISLTSENSCIQLIDALLSTNSLLLSGIHTIPSSDAACGSLTIKSSDQYQDEGSGYYCKDSYASTMIGGDIFCYDCRAGSYYSNGTCLPCEVGYYQDESCEYSCKRCPEGYSTLTIQSNSDSQCIPYCSAGMVSATGFPPCEACPDGQEAINSTTCIACPGGSATLGSHCSPDGPSCEVMCGAGNFSLSGYPPCTPCPVGFYQAAEGSTYCDECNSTLATPTTGATNESFCSITEEDNCLNNPCSNGGNCSVQFHFVTCQCPPGYTGKSCETDIDDCASQPCYNDAECVDEVDGFTCLCPVRSQTVMQPMPNQRPSFLGDFVASTSREYCKRICLNMSDCEMVTFYQEQYCLIYYTNQPLENIVDPVPSITYIRVTVNVSDSNDTRCSYDLDDCLYHECENRGKCKDGNDTYECVCPLGGIYTGDRCQNVRDKCEEDPCQYGNCTSSSPYHRQCHCLPGYTGRDCETDIDECASSPCFNNGTCVNMVNGFRCQCEAQFSGPYCQTMLNSCASITCGGQGTCVYDYIQLKPRCVCNQGYTQDYFWSGWMNNDSPGGDGDMETPATWNSSQICGGSRPLDIECRDVGTRLGYNSTDDVGLECDVTKGFMCWNSNQTDLQCQDYEIRFKCDITSTFDVPTCLEINDCSYDPCVYGSCVDLVGRYQCNCQTGYTGYNCQHNQDNCIYSPCQNGGTCVDLIDGYSCNCTAGYTGQTCLQEVNECNLNPCDSVGTLPDGCGDLLGDFSCQCRPGYTGKQCSVERDECSSSPCLHGGSCTDRLNGFECNCTEGWQGNQCQTMVDRCTNNTCRNGARCENTFTDYFCLCHPGTFGRYCENYPSVCNVTSPCLNDGTCTESGGVASCQCTPDYTGDNCEIQKQHCIGNTCLNGGTCAVAASPPGYSCTCAKGFTGGHCETNIDDCRNVNCGTEGVCRDGVNQHFCHCPINRMGALCDRNVDTDYDMVFGCDGGLAYSSYPVMWNTSEFTIGFWIGVSSVKNTGAVLALYQGRSLTNSYPEIMVMSISLSSLDMRFNNDSQTFSFSQSHRQTLTDGGWHAIQVMWEGFTGQLTVMLDGQIAVNDTYQQGYLLNGNMLLGLGDLYSSNGKQAVEESGFCGAVSLVQAWDRVLQPSEITLGLLQHVPVTTGLIMNWNRYLRERHVSVSAPSTRTEQSCIPGIKGPACNTGSVDRKAPQVINCTTSQLVVTSTRTVRVMWDEPMFVDAISVDSNYRPGEQMGQGEYQVVYVAKDIAGNAAFCSFMVYVRGADNICTDPPAPYGGQAPVCQQHDGTFFRSCSGPCLPNRVPLRPGPKFHTCGPAGYFNIQNPGEPFIFTPCTELDTFGREKKITVHMTYGTITCNAQVAQTIRNEVLLKMEALHQFQIDSFGGVGICGTDRGANCSNIEVTVTCVDPSTRRTKRGVNSPTTAVDVVIVINKLPVSLGLGVEPEDALTKDILLDGKLNSESVSGGDVINSFSLTSDLLCPSGRQPLGQTCAPCVPGTFYNSSSQVCEDCPLGQYQPATSAVTCIPCSSNETTIIPRATSVTDCVEACGAGYFFNISGNICAACARGYYSEQPGLASCLGCPPGRTTPGEAATSAAQCVDECDSGYELQADGQCVMCEVGTYREKNQHYLCQNCGGYTTLGRGAVYQEECNITACPPGTKRVGEPGVCDLCPQGSYQPLKWQTNCIPCNVSERTDSTGSILPSDCKFFCKAGYFISGTTCEPCPLNTYKDAGSYYAVNCTSCPVGAVTLTANATSSADCKYSECSAGYTVNHARRECIPCPRGYYQPVTNPVHEQCLECPGDTTTATTATASLAGCTKVCPSGEYLYGSDCKLCDWGYYKNNSESELASIGSCVICPTDYITPIKGGKGLGECTAANCTPGLYRDVKTETCFPCPIGTYQYIRWQTYCMPCPDKKSTRAVGAADISLCVDVCGVGYQNSSRTFQCEPCPIGYYKNWTEIDIEIEACQLCENGLITASVASTDVADCRVGNCTAGYYTSGSSCTLCDYGYYQPDKWQSSCIKCPEDYTTSIKGSTSSTDCTVPLDQSIVAFKLRVLSLDFTDNLQDSNSNAHKTMGSLVEQKIFEYLQSQGVSGLTSQSVRVRAFSPGSVLVDFVVYVRVDDVQKTFEAVSAAVNNGILNTLVLDKTVKNVVVLASGVQGCGGGFGLNYLTGVCEPCPLGTYQPAGVENSCYQCPQYYSTVSTGSLTKDDCKNICDVGRTYCENGGSCVWHRAQDKPTCTCPNTYHGDKCHYRKEDSASKNWIIGVTVGVFGGSILVCLAVVGLFAYSRHSKHKKNISSTESTVSSEDFPPYVIYPPQHFSYYQYKYPASRLYMPSALGYVETQYVPAKKSRRDYSPDRNEFSWQEAK